MTEQEIEKLREKLGSDYSVKRLNGAITVELVDIWKGVEFAISDYNGMIYKIDRFENSPMRKIWFSHGKFLFPEKCKPSTESAYVEQLKAKAKELYGDIKDGDRFELDGIEFIAPIGFELRYVSEHDKLVLDNYMKCPHIYKQGKWAKKIERVRVEGNWNSYDDNCIKVNFKFDYKGNYPGPSSIASHLAKCLEDYLNNS